MIKPHILKYESKDYILLHCKRALKIFSPCDLFHIQTIRDMDSDITSVSSCDSTGMILILTS